MGHMTHDEYIDGVRARAVILAQLMLRETESILERCLEMRSMLFEVECDEAADDWVGLPEDLTIFTLVASQTDHIPLGVSPELLEANYRERSEQEKLRVSKFYLSDIREGCRAVLQRYATGRADDPA